MLMAGHSSPSQVPLALEDSHGICGVSTAETQGVCVAAYAGEIAMSTPARVNSVS
jgi:hypothetical protein